MKIGRQEIEEMVGKFIIEFSISYFIFLESKQNKKDSRSTVVYLIMIGLHEGQASYLRDTRRTILNRKKKKEIESVQPSDSKRNCGDAK